MVSTKGEEAGNVGGDFRGFAVPESNCTFVPNQFFDIVIPYSKSITTVRLVAYVLYRQLAWCDEHSKPQDPHVQFSWKELEKNAGINRALLSKALKEAETKNYITCVKRGRSDSNGQHSESPCYELCWDDESPWHTNPEKFSGFFGLEGNRTFIPNEFFHRLIPNENLGVIKVVAAIVRDTICWRDNRTGYRRQRTSLSVSQLERKTHLSRRAVRLALKHAVEQNYIETIVAGVFDPDAGRKSKAATYGLLWADRWKGDEDQGGTGLKSTTEKIAQIEATFQTGLESTTEKRFKKDHGTGLENTTVDRFKKYHDIKSNNKNNLENKTTTGSSEDSVVVVDIEKKLLLTENGFSERDAEDLANRFSLERITSQIEWLPFRNPQRNPTGMLRKAIEEDWDQPILSNATKRNGKNLDAENFARHYYAGFHGNDEEPVSEPFEKDLLAATAFINRLLEISSDTKQIPNWGKRFGQMVRSKNLSHQKTIHFLSTAITLFGDEFYVSFRREAELNAALAERIAQEEHQEKFKKRYAQYIRGAEETLKEKYPNVYEEFLMNRKRRMAALYKKGIYEPSHEIMTKFESPEFRLKAFWTYFVSKKKHPNDFPILDFWEWDEEENPNRFEQGRAQA